MWIHLLGLLTHLSVFVTSPPPIEAVRPGCKVEDNLQHYDMRRDYALMDSILNIDTLPNFFNPRMGIYLKVIGFIQLDSISPTTNDFHQWVMIRGDTIHNQAFKAHFQQQCETYLKTMTQRFKLNRDRLDPACRNLILMRKIRFCG